MAHFRKWCHCWSVQQSPRDREQYLWSGNKDIEQMMCLRMNNLKRCKGNSRPKYLVIVLQEVYRAHGGQQTLTFISFSFP
jgi:hypothetical protein